MNRIIILLTVIFCALQASAQSADGRYTSRMTLDGMLYFMHPKKITKCDGIERFEYDMTLLSWTDSVTVNFTFKSKSVAYPENLQIQTCGKSIQNIPYSLLFTDIVKGGYSIRVTSKISSAELEGIVSCMSSPVFVFEQDGVKRTASYSDGAWKKDAKKLSDIYHIYKLRR